MTAVTHLLNGALLHSLWEDTAITLWAVLGLLRRHTPTARYAASCAALALMTCLPELTSAALEAPAGLDVDLTTRESTLVSAVVERLRCQRPRCHSHWFDPQSVNSRRLAFLHPAMGAAMLVRRGSFFLVAPRIQFDAYRDREVPGQPS